MSFKPKKSPKSSRWPHPPSFALTPEILASAGYFHDPAQDEPDRTTCWLCGESMKGWDEDDDPWALHLKWSSNCPFARISLLEHERDTHKPSWSDSPTHSWGASNEWFPRGSVLIEARLATFCGPNGPWKHEGKKGIPTRLELARAGFHFTPNLFKKGRKFDVDDTTSCCYCHRSVTEWEVDDDPVSVHLKKGACIFFTAVQPAAISAKPSAKLSRKPSKISRVEPPAKTSAVDMSLNELTSDVDGTDKPSKHTRKPPSTTSNPPQTGRRVLASSISNAVVAADERPITEPEDSITEGKTKRASRKHPPVNYAPPQSPELVEQPTSKPPVTLIKNSRLSRSTSKPTSNRSTSSSKARQSKMRASSNASNAVDNSVSHVPHDQTFDESNQSLVDKEDSMSKHRKSQRTRKPSKVNQPSSAVVSEAEENHPSRRPGRSRNPRHDEREMSTVGSEDNNTNARVEEDHPTKKSQLVGKTKPQTARALNPQVLSSQTMLTDPAKRPVNQGTQEIEPLSRSRGLSPTLFPDFNPQAPQLYPSLLPIAAKMISFAGGLRTKEQVAQELIEKEGLKNRESRPAVDPEPVESLIQEYLGQEPRPLPEGWLPNPYNPSRPLPPLTAEEAKMGLKEYFAYRAQQEEDAFLAWVEDRHMKPWLEAVERGKGAVEELIKARTSQKSNNNRRSKSVLKTTHHRSSALTNKENRAVR